MRVIIKIKKKKKDSVYITIFTAVQLWNMLKGKNLNITLPNSYVKLLNFFDLKKTCKKNISSRFSKFLKCRQDIYLFIFYKVLILAVF